MCALAVAPSPDTPSVDGASLDPLIADLGRLIGLLRPSDSRRYTLDREWFDHPLGAIRDGFRTHPAALTDLLERILGSLGGNALGVPASDPALLGTWIPIPNPANRAASVTPGPLYLVSYEHEGRTVYGFGVKVAWEKDLTADSGGSNGTLHGPPGIRAEAWALLPLLALDPENGVGPAVGNPGYPLSVGIAVEGRKSDDIAPIITAGVEPNLFSFDGIKISAEIDLATGPSVEVSVVVLGLELPGETAADRSLADLEALEASEIMQTASTLFVAALSDLSPAAAATAGYLLPVLGLSEFVPNIETRLPLLAWYDLAARAVAGQPVTGPFVEWFTTVVGDADLTRTWLASLAGLVGHPSPGKDAVTGRGTRAEPFLVPLIAPGGALPGSLAFAVASEVDAGSGVRHFYPGIAFALTPVALGAKAELTLRSEIELAEFGLSATRPIDYAGPASLRLTTALRLQGTGGTTSLFEGRIGGDDYVFGALHAGLELDAGGGIAPLFRLENVRSPAGVFDVVDLTSPGQLASRAEQELLALVQSGLKQMLGVQAGVDVPFGANLAALLGVIAPPAAASWPADAPQPPFSATRIVDSLQDPLGALARYYHALATTATTVDGHSPFRLVLQELAGLLQLAATNAGVTITGDGTETSPWRAMLSTHGTPLPAALLVSAVPTTEGRTRLTFGLELGPTVTVGALTLEPRALVRLLSVDLPSPGAGGSISAEWLPAVGMALNLPNGFRTPEVAGSSFRVGASALGATWSRRDGWHWSLLARKPEFTLGGTRLPFSADLDWSDRQSLENLVRQSADSFAPVLVGVLGLALTSRSTRIGTALTGFFGLLPDLSRTRNFPPQLADAWKTAAPAPLRIRHLDDPWPDLRAQVAANFASTPSARAVLGLLGWALQPGAADPPDVSGSGGSSDPWRVPIAGTAFEFLTWFESTERLLGCGLGRTDVFTSCPGLRVVARTSLGAACVSLASGTFTDAGGTPFLRFTAEVTGSRGNLVEIGGPGSAGGLRVAGWTLGLTLRLVAGGVSVEPVMNLRGVVLPGQSQPRDFSYTDLATLASNAVQGFETALNAAVQAAVNALLAAETTAAARATFRAAYDLLASLGLVLPVAPDASSGYGINPGGWQGLRADPSGYLRHQVLGVLSDPPRRTALFSFVADLLGVRLPTVPAPVLATLSALGILGSADDGYPLRPEALLDLARSPFRAVRARFEALFDGATGVPSEALKELLGTLNQVIPTQPFGPRFTFRVGQDGFVELGIAPEQAISLGQVVAISGSVGFDFSRKTASARLRLYNDTVRVALNPSFEWTLGGAFTPRLVLTCGDGTRPALESLTLVPFEPTTFLDQLARLAPAYVLSTVVTQVLEHQVLSQYPLAQAIFEGLGLVQRDSATGEWRMPSLQGLLADPRGWLLSPDVLGDDAGGFGIGSLRRVLARIPAAEAASLGIGVRPFSDGTRRGIEIYGFPYGFGAVVVTDGADNAEFRLEAKNIGLSAATLEKLQGGITLGPSFQPGITGALRVSGQVAGRTLYAEADYDRAFRFAVGQERQPEHPSALSIQLVPFEGWGRLVEDGVRAAASEVLDTLVPKLLDGLEARGAPTLSDLVRRLRTAGSELRIRSLLDRLLGIPLDGLTGAAVEKEALGWLLERFGPDNAASTAAAAVALLEGIPGLPGRIAAGTGSDAGLVTYRPTEKLPVTLYLGVHDPSGSGRPLLGLWLGVALPESTLLRARIERTGVGFEVARLSDAPPPVFQFDVRLVVPVEGGTLGPCLELAYDPVSHRFAGSFDPLFDSSESDGRASSLKGELFPDFFLSDPKTLERWLLDVVKHVLPRYVSAIVLATDSVRGWLDTSLFAGAGSPKPVDLLLGSRLLTRVGTDERPAYVLTDFDDLLELGVDEVLGGLLWALLKTPIPVLKWGNGDTAGGLWIGPEGDTRDSLGLRVVAPGLKFASVPNLTLQIGATDASWIGRSTSHPPKAEPGLSFYIPNRATGTEYRPDFGRVRLNLINLGLDVTGKAGRPLVDLARFQLGGVSPRALLTLELGDGTPKVRFGGAVTLDGIALSLAPSQASASGNPVAQNLLGSGSDAGSSPEAEAKTETSEPPPANPAFSIRASYLDTLDVALLGADGKAAPKIWFPVQRGFGPLYVNQLGVGWEPDGDPKRFDLLFDGRVVLAGFRADLMGLSVGIPVDRRITDFSQYRLGLDGFDLSYEGGSVEISAGFLKTESAGVVEYTGLATVKAAGFSLGAVGSYAAIPLPPPHQDRTAPSLFLFGALSAPLGGVPAFFVTGVAAGFSFNRGLRLPSITEVADFPLVTGVVNGSFRSDTPDDSKGVLRQLADDVYPEIGSYWLAAGIKFTSFSLLEGMALLFVRFGRSFELDLLGVASLTLPKGAPKESALAYAELALRVVVDPGQGVVSVEAQLTPNSYVLTRSCKLTGGFAFFVWFRNRTTADGRTIAAGDFVVSLGGYAARFKKPAHYPEVPRLGLTWPIELGFGSLHVAGGAYFALTPSAVMAGGYLDVLFQAGPIRAWFDAVADFYIGWAPFYYSVDVGISLGIAFRLELGGVSVTLRAALGASLHLEGPPTWGSVHVDWYVVSFTIPFGSGSHADTATLDWPAFAAQFLPAPGRADESRETPTPRTRLRTAPGLPVGTRAAAPAPDQAPQQVLKLQVESGLLRTDADTWIVRAEPFVLRVDSAIPISQPALTNPGAPSFRAGPKVGVQPMNLSAIDTPLSVSLHDVTGTEVDLARSPLRFEVLASASPRAAWGSDPFDRSRVPDGAKMLVEGTLGGLRLIGDGSRSESAVGPFPIERLNYTRNREGRLPFGAYPAYTASPPVPDQAHALARLSESIMAPDVVARRNQVFAALEKAGVAAAPDPDLSVMASSAARVLQAPPVLAHVGANLAAARPGAPLRSFAAIADFRTAGPAAIGSPARRPEIRLVGTLRRGPSADSGVSRARWTRAVARNARRTAAVRRGPPQATSAVLHSGTVTHWSGPVTHVEHRGGLPLRLTCFDANHEPLVDWHDVPGATIALPEGTSAVTLHGGAAAADRATSLAGWRLDDQVLRLNPRWFAGTGFLLRPQGAIDRRAASPGSSDGLLDVAEIADVNRLTDDKAGGWETLFDGARRSVAVRLLRGADPRRVEVAVKRTAAAYEAADRDYAAPVAVVEEPEGTVLFFEVPETPAVPAREHLSVWVESRSGRAVASGVHASFLSADELRRRWRELRSGDEGTTRTDDAFRTSTRVELRSEPAHRE